jgi:hypothetical protein
MRKLLLGTISLLLLLSTLASCENYDNCCWEIKEIVEVGVNKKISLRRTCDGVVKELILSEQRFDDIFSDADFNEIEKGDLIGCN